MACNFFKLLPCLVISINLNLICNHFEKKLNQLIKVSYFQTKISCMNWILLIIAGIFEAGFAACLGKAKESSGPAATWWLTGFFICLAISMFLLYKAVQSLPVGTAYAVWTGIGAVGTVIIGILIFKEPTDFWRIFFIVTLIGSVIGLKAVSHS